MAVLLPGGFLTSPNRLLLGVLNAFQGCPPCCGTACPPSVRLVTLCPSCWWLLCLPRRPSRLPSCWSLRPPCVNSVSFVSGLVSLLGGHCVHLASQVPCLHCWRPPFSAGHAACQFICLQSDFFTFSPNSSQCFLRVSVLLRDSVSDFHPACHPFPSCWSLCPPCLPSVSFCLPCHCVRLVPLLFPFVSLLVSCCCVCLSLANPLCSTLSPSSGLLCLPLACNPLHLFSALGRCVRLCHAILEFHVSPSADSCIRHCLGILYLCPSSQLHVACNPLHLSLCVHMCLPAFDPGFAVREPLPPVGRMSGPYAATVGRCWARFSPPWGHVERRFTYVGPGVALILSSFILCPIKYKKQNLQ